MRHCIVLPLTLALLIGARALQGIEHQSQHGLALATQIIFQLRKNHSRKGGLNQVPSAHPEPNSPPVIRAICEQIAGAVVASLATETILHHQISFQPLPAPGCTRLLQSAVTRLSPLHLAGQLHPSLASANCRQVLLSSSLTNTVGETNFWIGFRTPFWGHPQEPVLLEGSK